MTWPAIALAAPAGVLVASLALALVLTPFGLNPIWPDHKVTLSEAVAAGDDGEIARLIGEGQDPNVPYDVRRGLLFDRAARLTPLEAAVESGGADLIERLLRNGAVMDAAVWSHLRCLAGDDDVIQVLERGRPVGAVMRCDDGR